MKLGAYPLLIYFSSLFRGKLPILSEPSEPGAVLWKSLGKGGMVRSIVDRLSIALFPLMQETILQFY